MELIIDVLVIVGLIVWSTVGVIVIKNYVFYNKLIKPMMEPMMNVYKEMLDDYKEMKED